jgi:antitoxin (DNA-binding transcriptional repressor) of toxin-antitoxin stability system
VATPSTATGSLSVAALRNRPCARLVPATAGRLRVARRSTGRRRTLPGAPPGRIGHGQRPAGPWPGRG